MSEPGDRSLKLSSHGGTRDVAAERRTTSKQGALRINARLESTGFLLGRLALGWISASRSVRAVPCPDDGSADGFERSIASSMVGTLKELDLRAMRAVSNSGGVRVHRCVGRPATRWQPRGATNRPTLDLGLVERGAPHSG